MDAEVTSMPVSLALIGAGRIGQVHASAVGAHHDARLVALHEPNADLAAATAARHGASVRSIEDILGDAGIDAILICSPTNTHADLIQRGVDAGKAVFCEKPIDLSLERATACVEHVERAGGTLMLGFNRRFDPSFASVRRAAAEGVVGEVEHVTIVSRDPSPPPADYIKVSGGMLRDMTIHDFDMARFVLGEEPDTVFATGSVLVDPKIGELGDIDTATLVLTTPSGRQCTIVNSRRATYGYDQRLEVAGSKGIASAQNERPLSVELATSQGFRQPPLHDFFMTRYTAAYAAEIAAFVDCVANGTAPSPDGRDGVAALRLAEAGVQSLRQGRAVRLSEIG